MTVPHPERPSRRQLNDAQRLYEQGHVFYLPDARVYPVIGDTTTNTGAPLIYKVIKDHTGFSCSCPATKHPCKHVLAVQCSLRPGNQPARAIRPTRPEGTTT